MRESSNPEPPKPVRPLPDARRPAPPPSPPPSPPRTAGTRTVLVVEDDAIVREGMRFMVADWGHAALTAETCEEALALVQGGAIPDLVITDFRLPGRCTGTELIRCVRHAAGRRVPAILITGDTGPERAAEAQAEHFHLLHKPVAPTELERTVVRILDTVGSRRPVPAD